MQNSAAGPQHEDWRHSVDRRLDDLERDMVTKAEILPLQTDVNEAKRKAENHERLITRGKNVLVWLGVATLTAAVISPHAGWVKDFVIKWLLMQ